MVFVCKANKNNQKNQTIQGKQNSWTTQAGG